MTKASHGTSKRSRSRHTPLTILASHQLAGAIGGVEASTAEDHEGGSEKIKQ